MTRANFCDLIDSKLSDDAELRKLMLNLFDRVVPADSGKKITEEQVRAILLRILTVNAKQLAIGGDGLPVARCKIDPGSAEYSSDLIENSYEHAKSLTNGRYA